MAELHALMRSINVHAQSYIMMGEEDRRLREEYANNMIPVMPELYMSFVLKDNLDANIFNVQKCNEVAAIFTMNADGVIPNNFVTIVNRSDKILRRLNSMEPNVEPWTCPLLFPHGTVGWNYGMKKLDGITKLTRLKYIRYIIAIRGYKFNPFILARRLFQQYLVDSYVKVERDRIDWIRTHQKKLKQEAYDGLMDYIHSRAHELNKQVGRIVILPSSFVGSTRYLMQIFQDAMTIAFFFRYS